MIIALTGCATRDEAAVETAAEDERVTGTPACFYRRQVSDFRALDRANLIVYAPTKSNAYHVRISPPTTSLKWADTIAFQSRSGRICGYAGERLLLDGAGAARGFSVAGVYRLDETTHDELLVQYGLGKGATGLEPAETAGAEIERDIESDESDNPGDE
jgi:hypothetical protein